MRAAERREHSFRREQVQRAEVDVLVAAQCVIHLALAACERRRIEHDEIELRATAAQLCGPEEIEHVLRAHIHREAVACHVAADVPARVLADFHGGHMCRAGLRAGERERALICKTIQHAPALRVVRDGCVAVHLVEIKSGLLPAHEIHFKLQPADGDRKRRGRFAVQHGHILLHAFRNPHRRVVARDDARGLHDFEQRGGDEVEPHVHRERERLHHEVITVAIHDEPR